MKKLYALALSAMVAVGAFTASAIEEGVTVTMNPTNHSSLSEFPASFTMTFEGTYNGATIESIAKNPLAANPVKIQVPGETSWVQCPAESWNGNTVTIKTNPNIDRTTIGEYKIQLVSGGVMYVTTIEGVQKKNKCAADMTSFSYTVSKASDIPSSWTIMDGKFTVTVDPAPAAVEEFPAEFTLTFEGEGLQNIKKPFSGNPVRILAPGETSWQAGNTCTFSGKTLTVKTSANIDRTVKGKYTIELNKDKVIFVTDDGNVNIAQTALPYTIEGENEPIDDSVKENLEIRGLVPINFTSKSLDVSMKTLETLQIVINAKDVKPVDNAIVTISGPAYKQYALLTYSTGTIDGKGTTLKAMFTSDPVFNGEYTLSIPAHAMGTPEWFENPEKGQTNAAIEFKFEVTGGRPQSEITDNTIFNPLITPANGTEVQSSQLDEVTLKFDSKAYYKEDALLKLGYKADLMATAYADFTTGTITRVSDTELKVVFEEKPSKQGGYQLIIPKGTFWDEAHNADETTGAINDEVKASWLLFKALPECKVLSTVPAANAKVAQFGKGECIVINTDNNEAIAKMTFTVNSYVLDDDSGNATIVVSGSSTTKNAEGAIVWNNDGDVIKFDTQHTYELEFALFDKDDYEIAGNVFNFEGKDMPEVKVVSTIPTADAKIVKFAKGDNIVVNTDNNAAVAKMTFKVVAEPKEEGAEATVILSGESSTKNADGAISWTNEGEDVVLVVNQNYKFEFSLFDADGDLLVSDAVSFVGNEGSGVESIEVENAPKAVFNIQGVRVNAPADQLPAGLYIIDGKKVFINK